GAVNGVLTGYRRGGTGCIGKSMPARAELAHHRGRELPDAICVFAARPPVGANSFVQNLSSRSGRLDSGRRPDDRMVHRLTRHPVLRGPLMKRKFGLAVMAIAALALACQSADARSRKHHRGVDKRVEITGFGVGIASTAAFFALNRWRWGNNGYSG